MVDVEFFGIELRHPIFPVRWLEIGAGEVLAGAFEVNEGLFLDSEVLPALNLCGVNRAHEKIIVIENDEIQR